MPANPFTEWESRGPLLAIFQMGLVKELQSGPG